MASRRGELHEVLKASSIETLAKTFGPGVPFYVPMFTANAEHIAQLIGYAETSALVDALGGDQVYLPVLENRRKGRRYGETLEPSLEAVKRHTAESKSARDIASLYGCSRRTVYNKRKKLREAEGVRNGKERERSESDRIRRP